MKDSRRTRLDALCALYGVSRAELAARLDQGPSAVSAWQARGSAPDAVVLAGGSVALSPDRPVSAVSLAWALNQGDTSHAGPVDAVALLPGGPWPSFGRVGRAATPRLDRLQEQTGAPELDDVAEAFEALADAAGGVMRAYKRQDPDQLDIAIEAMRAIIDEQGWKR